MRILVLGAYGLIGQAVVRELASRGHGVSGLARDASRGAKLLPQIRWLSGDLNRLVQPEDWASLLDGVEAVVNASGALQSGMIDDLGRIQRDSIVALMRACETAGVSRFVQISAPGAAVGATTEFLATKGQADAALRSSKLEWVILKPGLVISETAYGGTSLLRMLAAVPYVQPVALGQARLQSVSVRDVARAVRRAVEESKLVGGDYDLVSAKAETLEDTILAFRNWLGFRAPAILWHVPDWFARSIGWCADLVGLFGWSAPLRSTALAVLRDDVVGDAEPWRRATGEDFQSLAGTLRDMPATRQERIFARVQLAFPLLLLLFSAFWIVSGIVGVWQYERAGGLISEAVGVGAAYMLVFGGAVVDVAVGLGLLLRRTFVPACIAAIVVSCAYLLMGSILTPELWADPLGPLVKIFPVIGVSLGLMAMAEER